MFRQRKTKLLDDEGLYAYAIKQLGGRALSIGEVRTRLMARAAPGADIEKTIARLKEYGFLDDRRFAENFAAARRDNQALGKFRVAQDLKKRRVAPALADETVAAAYTGVEESALIAEYMARKLRGKDLRDERTAASAYRRLRMAGFSSAAIIRALKQFTPRADELESLETEHRDESET